MARTVQINLRIETQVAHELERIAEAEALRRTDLIRKYLIEGIRRWKLEQAITRYQRGEITLERAAVDAGLSLYEMMDQLRRRGIALDQTTPEEAREAIIALLAREQSRPT